MQCDAWKQVSHLPRLPGVTGLHPGSPLVSFSRVVIRPASVVVVWTFLVVVSAFLVVWTFLVAVSAFLVVVSTFLVVVSAFLVVETAGFAVVTTPADGHVFSIESGQKPQVTGHTALISAVTRWLHDGNPLRIQPSFIMSLHLQNLLLPLATVPVHELLSNSASCFPSLHSDTTGSSHAPAGTVCTVWKGKVVDAASKYWFDRHIS